MGNVKELAKGLEPGQELGEALELGQGLAKELELGQELGEALEMGQAEELAEEMGPKILPCFAVLSAGIAVLCRAECWNRHWIWDGS